jgi:hypothetical protein
VQCPLLPIAGEAPENQPLKTLGSVLDEKCLGCKYLEDLREPQVPPYTFYQETPIFIIF